MAQKKVTKNDENGPSEFVDQRKPEALYEAKKKKEYARTRK